MGECCCSAPGIQGNPGHSRFCLHKCLFVRNKPDQQPSSHNGSSLVLAANSASPGCDYLCSGKPWGMLDALS